MVVTNVGTVVENSTRKTKIYGSNLPLSHGV